MCPKEIVTYSLGHMNKRRVLIEHLSVVYLRYKYKKTSVTRPPRFTASLAIFDEKHVFFKRKQLFFFEKTVCLVFLVVYTFQTKYQKETM